MIHQLKLLRRLNLTAEQQEAVKAALGDVRERVVQQVGKLSELHRELEDAIEATAGEAALRAKAEALGALYGDVAVLRAAVLARLNTILTADQKSKAAELRVAEEVRSREQQQRVRATLKERIEKGGNLSILDVLAR
jgi:Spy/CpxP family protein refolding chaperone